MYPPTYPTSKTKKYLNIKEEKTGKNGMSEASLLRNGAGK
jgi:hypothetical protein